MSKEHDNATVSCPVGWTQGFLAEFIQESTERNTDRLELPVYSVTNTRGFVPQLEQFARSIHSKDTVNYKVFRKGSFGFNPARINVGSIALNEVVDAGLLSPMYVVFTTREMLHSSYLKHYTETYDFRRNVLNGTAGTVRESLNFSAFKGFPFQFPASKSEQAKIAEILSAVDHAIEQTEALIAKQQRIKTGLMQDLLTRGIDERGNVRSEGTHEFKNSQLGRIPVEWSATRLGEHCAVYNNLRKPLSAQVRDGKKGDYRYYGPTGVLDYIDEYRVEGQYVLIGEDGDHFLKFANQEMTLLVDGKYNVNNHAHLIRGKGGVLTEWLHLFFLHRDITLHLTRQGAARLKLNKAALLELPMAAPKDPGEQRSILKIIDTCRLAQSHTLVNLGKLRSLKTALMQDLLASKRRVAALLPPLGS